MPIVASASKKTYIEDKKRSYRSVESFLSCVFTDIQYSNDELILEANLLNDIERYYRGYYPLSQDITVWTQFMTFDKEYSHLSNVVCNKIVIEDSSTLAGKIPAIYTSRTGSRTIVSWKRSSSPLLKTSKHEKYALPPLSRYYDTNFWRYAVELNIYAYILAAQNQPVNSIWLIQFDPEGKEYLKYEIPMMLERVKTLIAMASDKSFV